ncbi:NADH dehydrogenase [ubiquinone] iron-sulfur protein 6, mitochondrial-like [Ornithodoros turicata]|uniref:NADH dehydrogenase [ubiquinone] iron-sulfur protein 6, mitochondrial-like n=1 Tax=Ornithodoros turicata TaxID=34597 RepID=UPI003139F9D6
MAHSLRNTLKLTRNLRQLPARGLSGSSTSDWVPKDPETHTGQHWEKDDYRLARFINTPKQINKNFAIDLIKEVPPKAVNERLVWCDGGDGALGHPKVYINLDKPGNHACGYCGLRYYKSDHH